VPLVVLQDVQYYKASVLAFRHPAMAHAHAPVLHHSAQPSLVQLHAKKASHTSSRPLAPMFTRFGGPTIQAHHNRDQMQPPGRLPDGRLSARDAPHHQGWYSRSLKNPALQLSQKSSKSASTIPQRLIWHSFSTLESGIFGRTVVAASLSVSSPRRGDTGGISPRCKKFFLTNGGVCQASGRVSPGT